VKRLYRSRANRVFGGVAAGVADYFDVDPTLVRLIWVVLALTGGIGVVAYLIAWAIVPEAPVPETPPIGVTEAPPAGSAAPDAGWGGGRERSSHSNKSFGTILIVIGTLLLAERVIPSFVMRSYWPVLLILLGGYFIASARP
jgi:phage shock protein C